MQIITEMVKFSLFTEKSIVAARKIIVLTPIKNEEWILETFLNAAELYADVIILLDQNSTDSSKEIAKKHQKVEVFENNSHKFNEKERQNLLLDKARNHGSNNVIISLDADEIFTPDFCSPENLEWLQSLEIGTSICYDWANIHWTKDKYWQSKMQPIIFIDNGQKNLDKKEFHRTRVPVVGNKKIIYNKQTKVLHLQYINKERLRSKHRWYQLHEFQENRDISFVHLYRKYHHMFGIKKDSYKKLPKEWENYLTEIDHEIRCNDKSNGTFWWETEVLKIMETIQPKDKAKIDLDFELNQVKHYSDSRQMKITDKIIFMYLSLTQKLHGVKFKDNFIIYITIRVVDYFVGKFWR